MMMCRDIAESASDYLEHKLPFRRRVSVRLHLLMCKHCRTFVEQLKVSIDSLHSLDTNEPEPISEDTRERLLALFRDHRDDLETP